MLKFVILIIHLSICYNTYARTVETPPSLLGTNAIFHDNVIQLEPSRELSIIESHPNAKLMLATLKNVYFHQNLALEQYSQLVLGWFDFLFINLLKLEAHRFEWLKRQLIEKLKELLSAEKMIALDLLAYGHNDNSKEDIISLRDDINDELKLLLQQSLELFESSQEEISDTIDSSTNLSLAKILRSNDWPEGASILPAVHSGVILTDKFKREWIETESRSSDYQIETDSFLIHSLRELDKDPTKPSSPIIKREGTIINGARKFYAKYGKQHGQNGARIIYKYLPEQSTIVLLGIYLKANKEDLSQEDYEYFGQTAGEWENLARAWQQKYIKHGGSPIQFASTVKFIQMQLNQGLRGDLSFMEYQSPFTFEFLTSTRKIKGNLDRTKNKIFQSLAKELTNYQKNLGDFLPSTSTLHSMIDNIKSKK